MSQRVFRTAIAVAISSFMAFSLAACDKATVADTPTDVVASKFDVVTKIQGKTFGTFFFITVPGGYPGGEETLRSDAEFVFKKVATAISTFDQDAELARFNKFESTELFPISNYLADILEESIHQGRRIDGAMDPTVGPLVNLWGFGPDGQIKESPSEETINEVRSHVGLDKISIRRSSEGNQAMLQKTDPRVQLDLSTIGEGLAADEIAALLDEKGIQNYMIAVAGAIRSKGANPDGKLWRVGIEDPLSQGQTVFEKVCPQDMAISTAGSYRNFFLDSQNNKFYSHIIDPKMGRPIEHRTVSVTVIDSRALVTDALDTGLLVLGAQKAVKWGNDNDVPVYAIEINEDGQEIATYSKAFEKYLKCTVTPGTRADLVRK